MTINIRAGQPTLPVLHPRQALQLEVSGQLNGSAYLTHADVGRPPYSLKRALLASAAGAGRKPWGSA